MAVADSAKGVDFGMVTLAGKLPMTGTALFREVLVKHDRVAMYVFACW